MVEELDVLSGYGCVDVFYDCSSELISASCLPALLALLLVVENVCSDSCKKGRE